jgi:hypothetical protein
MKKTETKWNKAVIGICQGQQYRLYGFFEFVVQGKVEEKDRGEREKASNPSLFLKRKRF